MGKSKIKAQSKIVRLRNQSKLYDIAVEAFKMIIVSLYPFFSVFCFLDAIKIKLSFSSILFVYVFWAIVFYVIFEKLYQAKPGIRKFELSAILIVYFVYAFTNLQNLLYGLQKICDYFIISYNVYFNKNFVINITSVPSNLSGSNFRYDIENVTVFIGVILLILVSKTVYQKKSCVPALIMGLCLAVLPLTIGQLPNYLLFFGYVITLIGIYNLSKSDNLQVSVISVFIAFCLLMIICFVYTPNIYKKTYNVSGVKTEVQEKMQEIGDKTFSNLKVGTWINYMSAKGVEFGNLRGIDKLEYNNVDVLKVNMSKHFKDYLYLKGYVGTVYQDDEWKGISDKGSSIYKDYSELTEFMKGMGNGLGPENYHNFSVEDNNYINVNKVIDTSSLKIENLAAGRNRTFVPYYTKDLFDMDKDGLLELTKDSKDPITYYPMDQTNLSGKLGVSALYDLTHPDKGDSTYSKVNTRYSDFVNQYYHQEMDTCKANQPEFIEAFKKNYVQTSNPVDSGVTAYINGVKDYLYENVEYTLAPGKVPDGKNFVDYFLFENKKGTCVHYATAATIILRACGVNARYVEGYRIRAENINWTNSYKENEEAGYEITAKDSDAHAWVEVYDNTFGWIPIEVTNSPTDEGELKALDPSTAKRINNMNKAQSAISTTSPSTKPSQNPDPTTSQKETKAPVLSHGDSTDVRGLIVKGILLLFIAFCLGLVVRICYVIARRRFIMKQNHANKKAVLLFRELAKVLSHFGIQYQLQTTDEFAHQLYEAFHHEKSTLKEDDFENFVRTVFQAAYYDKVILKEEEINETERFYRTFQKEMYLRLTIFQKVYLKLIFWY